MSLLLLVLACTPATVDDTAPVPGDGGSTAGTDGGSATETATDGGSTTETATDGGVEDDPVETLPDGEAPPPGLCRVELDCGRTVPDEGRIRCRLTVEDSAGHVHWDDHAGVELRGRSSGSAPKHQYSVELWDEDGTEREANLLGMGAEADWVLNGNYYDRALVRNPLAYDLFRAAGEVGDVGTRYAAEHRYCELTLDGQWQGIYSLMERVKRDDDRLDLEADDGTGQSFVLKLHDSDYLRANALGYGGWKAIYPSEPDAAQRAGISAFLAGWELAATTDPASLEDWLELDSWVDLVLLEELLKNTDAYYLSLHTWRDGGGRLQISPWDLDLSLGQPSYNDNENPHSWVLYRPTLVASLGQVPGFDERLADRWAELRAGPWATDQLLARIDAFQETMGAEAIAANFEVWPIDEIAFGHYLYEVESYEEEDARVRRWIERRAEWMDANIGAWSSGP